jgi:hypothetical protein
VIIIGDRVTWTSQSAGIVKTKVGEVVRVLQPGERPGWKNQGASRDHVSYVVRATHGKLYWPRVSQLQPCSGSEGDS